MNPDNTPLPSERELAELLGVNRRTLRKALQSFSHQLSCGPLGMVVHKQTAADIALTELHPQLFNNHHFFLESCHTLTLGIYENLPAQQKFWNQITAEFNRTNSSHKIVVEFISPRIKNFTKYIHDALSGNSHFDLIQLPIFGNSRYDEKK